MRRKTGIGWIEMPQRGSLLPYRGVLSFLSKAREAPGSEAARVHHAARRGGSGVAVRGAWAAGRQATHHRLSRLELGFRLEPMDRRVREAAARVR